MEEPTHDSLADADHNAIAADMQTQGTGSRKKARANYKQLKRLTGQITTMVEQKKYDKPHQLNRIVKPLIVLAAVAALFTVAMVVQLRQGTGNAVSKEIAEYLALMEVPDAPVSLAVLDFLEPAAGYLTIPEGYAVHEYEIFLAAENGELFFLRPALEEGVFIYSGLPEGTFQVIIRSLIEDYERHAGNLAVRGEIAEFFTD